MNELKMEVAKLLENLNDLEPKTIEEMVLKIIEMVDEGFKLTYEENDVNHSSTMMENQKG